MIVCFFGGQLGLPEVLLILAAIVLVFGSTQIPKIARSIGEALKEFKKSVKEAKETDDEEETRKPEKAKKTDKTNTK